MAQSTIRYTDNEQMIERLFQAALEQELAPCLARQPRARSAYFTLRGDDMPEFKV